jgi:methyltransferase (TIGR00027 family)
MESSRIVRLRAWALPGRVAFALLGYDRGMNPMQTAAPIAGVRAAEASRPESERLFVDPYAHLFADATEEVTRFFAQIPFFTEHVRLRTRYMDDAVRRAVAGVVRDIVLVGAGFDCRALRVPEIAAAGARVVEVDHAEQLAGKRRLLAAAGITLPPHVVHAAADLAQGGELERALVAAGVSRTAPVLWICEGVFGYLSPAELRALAASTASLCGSGSSLVGNYNSASLAPDLVHAAFTGASWRLGSVPPFAELHATFIGRECPAGHEGFQLLDVTR